jgi:hypothetical protein
VSTTTPNITIEPVEEPPQPSQMAPELGKRGSYSATYGPPSMRSGLEATAIGVARAGTAFDPMLPGELRW